MTDWQNPNPYIGDAIDTPTEPPTDADDASAPYDENPDGSPKLDYLTEAEAEAQAAKLGGTVERVGVAFHVNAGS